LVTEKRKPKWYSTSQFAEEIDIDGDLALKLIANGELAAVNISSKKDAKRPTYRISAEAVEAFLASRAVGPAPAKPKRPARKSTSGKFYS
jgi:hypothetical protein